MAQFVEKYGRYDSIPFMSSSGDTLQNPWVGGFNSLQVSELDLDQDGVMDLLLFDRDGGILRTFLNDGSQQGNPYHYAPQYEKALPGDLYGYVLTYDYDADGRMDIFTAHPFGMMVYRNTSDTALRFEERNDFLDLDSNEVYYLTMEYEAPWGLTRSNVFTYVDDVPALGDFNGDGYMDIVSFGVFGSYAEYYENRGVGPKDLDLLLKTQCWGVFAEGGTNNDIVLRSYCADSGGTDRLSSPSLDPARGAARHVGSALLAIDLDQDLDKDLFISDVSFNNTKALINGGDTKKAEITSVQVNYPTGTDPIDLAIFPGSYYIDLDNDGVKDLIVSPNNVGASDDFENVWFYKNNGQDDLPDFEFIQKDFLSDEVVDLGTMASPVFVDINGDSLLDIVSGNYGEFQSFSEYQSRLVYFKNTGTYTDSSAYPKFELADNDYLGFAQDPKWQGLAPAFGDMDADGDLDMVLGEVFGNTIYYENQAASPGDSAIFVRKPTPWDSSLFVGYNPSLTLYDVDEDADLDLVSGGRYGKIFFFENTGSTSLASFSESAKNEDFGKVEILNLIGEGFTSPSFALLDDSLAYNTRSNGASLKMLVGSYDGRIFVYGNIDGNLGGTFTGLDTMKVNAKNLRLHLGDVSKDGKPDIVYGENSGGMSFILQDKGFKLPAPNVIQEIEEEEIEMSLFPNPANDICFLRSPDEVLQIDLLDVQGKLLPNRMFDLIEEDLISFSISDLLEGIHLVRIQTKEAVILKKFFKLPSHGTQGN